MSEWLFEATRRDLLHLSNEELHSLGVQWASYNLFSLMDRPGLDVLSSLPFATLFPWHGKRVLDLTLTEDGKWLEGGLQYRSKVDGRTIFISFLDLKQWAQKDCFSKVLISSSLQERLFLSGDKCINQLVGTKRLTPIIEDANKGLLYTKEGTLELFDKAHRMSQKPVCQQCICTTCNNYTRSYLHHLSQEVPALSQRLQQYHNVYFSLAIY